MKDTVLNILSHTTSEYFKGVLNENEVETKKW